MMARLLVALIVLWSPVLSLLAPISNVDAGGVERADAHGIALRRK